MQTLSGHSDFDLSEACCRDSSQAVLVVQPGCKSWRLVTKVVGEMLSGPKECENLFFASFQRDADAML
ncbi:MAG: hypothetical protein R6U27_00965 [Desulfobacterales bacterium]